MIIEGGVYTQPLGPPDAVNLFRGHQLDGFLLPLNPENPGRIQQKRISLIERWNKGKFPAFPSGDKTGTMKFLVYGVITWF
jgi:hypothetical protein